MGLHEPSLPPIAQPDDAIHRLGTTTREMRRGYPAFHAHLFLGAFDLDVGQQDVLELLVFDHPDGCTMGTLASAMRVAPSSATRAVDRLIKRGLATRSQSSDDRRQFVVAATPKGIDLMRRLYVIGSPRFRQAVTSAFSPEEIETLVNLLARFVRMQDEHQLH